jgi:hypothetical protein
MWLKDLQKKEILDEVFGTLIAKAAERHSSS